MKFAEASKITIYKVHEYINNTIPKSVKDECFILANDPLDHIIMVSCNSNLDFMCDSQTLYNRINLLIHDLRSVL